MDNSLYIALLNPSIALVLASAFFVLWLYRRQHRYILALALGYTTSSGGFLLQHFELPIGFDATKLVSNILFFAATLLIVGAVINRYRRPLPVLALAALTVLGLGSWSWFMFVEAELTARLYATNFALGGMSLLVAAELRAVPNKTTVDRALLALSVLSCLNFMVRPVAIIKAYGAYGTYEGFYASLYWTTAILSHAVLSLLIAFALITAIALDLIAELRNQSETDSLSGLLNRRGFENAVEAALLPASRGVPVSVVVADLDHFKTVNDTFGHACGDSVISTFAGFLRQVVVPGHVAGRVGGEEFAIIMPGADLATARLFAEAVRLGFSMLAVPGLSERRCTASFGIAELKPGETATGLLRRADEALYQAKRAGRDCVRTHIGRPLLVDTAHKAAPTSAVAH